MTQVVCCQPVITEAQFYNFVGSCRIYCGQSGTGTGFSLSPLVSLLVAFYRGSTLIYYLGDE
jgi:hypothetical protein